MNKAIKEIRGTDSAELKGQLVDLRKEQWQMRFQGAGDASSMTRRGAVRRQIARILTVLQEREAQKAGDQKQ